MQLLNEKGQEIDMSSLQLGDLVLIMPPSTWESDYPPLGLFISVENIHAGHATVTIETWSDRIVPDTAGRLCKNCVKSYEVEDSSSLQILARDSESARALLNYIGCPNIKVQQLQAKIDRAATELR